MKILLLGLFALTIGCSSAENVNQFFDRLEFEEGQQGCIRATGQLQVGGNPFASSSVNVNLVKTQGEDVPDC